MTLSKRDISLLRFIALKGEVELVALYEEGWEAACRMANNGLLRRINNKGKYRPAHPSVTRIYGSMFDEEIPDAFQITAEGRAAIQ